MTYKNNHNLDGWGLLLAFAAILLLMFSSGCLLPKEVRQSNRAKAKIYRLAKKHNLQHIEVIEFHDTIIVPEVKTDTVFGFQTLNLYDTLRIDTGRLVVKVVRLPGDSIWITGHCQTDTVYYHKTITIERPVVKETDVWLIKAWRWVKGIWWLILIIIVLLIGGRVVYKTYF